MEAHSDTQVPSSVSEHARTEAVGEGSRDASEPVLLGKGDTLGRYVVLRKLGAGAMGTVYLGYDPELDRKVALKLLREAIGDVQRRALLREAQAMAKLSHPNVVAVYDVGEHDGQVHVAMAFVEGVTLREWLRAKPRHWREVLDKFLAAGEGLAAAHARELIHRDFKPDNVMVARDGGVMVMDFGLARPSTNADRHEADEDLGALSGSLSETLLTEATLGRVAGTPGYMAPEQLGAQSLDAKADQFAFCVSVWEGVCGQRPFAGRSIGALYLATSEGRITPPPSGARMPRWLERVLRRGLAPNGAARWPSMAALLGALERGRRRWRWQLASALLCAVALCVAMIVARQRQDARELQARFAACEAEGASIDEIWNPQAREQLREGMLATGLRFAPRDVDTLIPWLDAYHEAWRTGRTQACVHATIEQDWDAQLLDRSAWCFEDRRAQLEATVKQITELEHGEVRRAVRIASYLEPVESCLDTNVLQRLLPPPLELRNDIRSLRTELIEVERAEHQGRYEDAVELGAEGRARAEALAWPPLVAHTRLLEGRGLLMAGRYAESEMVLTRAYFEALDAGAIEDAFRAARSLIGTLTKVGRYREAELWSRHANALALELTDPLRLDEAEGQYLLTDIYLGLRDLDAAIAAGEASVSLRSAGLGDDHPITAAAMRTLGRAYLSAGRPSEALANYERAYHIWEDTVGPTHPNTTAMMVLRSEALVALDRLDEALVLIERALEIYERTLSEGHPAFAHAYGVLGDIRRAKGDVAEARRAYEKALTIDGKSGAGLGGDARRAEIERWLAQP